MKDKNDDITSSEIKESLQNDIPEPMIPAYYIFLDAIPLLPNGKINLQEIKKNNNREIFPVRSAYQPPENELEEKILNIWADALQLEKIGVNDNFFDIGGNSFLISEVTYNLSKLLNKDISMIEFFQYPTIRKLAQYFEPSGSPGPETPKATEQKINARKSFSSIVRNRGIRPN
jgi:acyl carrier protein